MNIIRIDLRNILRMKDFIHKFFSRLLKFLNESRVLIFIISSALEKIILVIIVISHQQNNFNLFYSISLFIKIFAIQIINILLLSSLILMFISILYRKLFFLSIKYIITNTICLNIVRFIFHSLMMKEKLLSKSLRKDSFSQ